MDATYTLRATNTAVLSDNKMHDDTVARTFGFAGGLVPGVDVYAYLAHLPAAMWGMEWLERGTLTARFQRPVYDGDDVEITAQRDGATITLSLSTGSAEPCASGTATLPETAATTAVDIPARPLPDDRPPASPESLAAGTVLGAIQFGFHAEHAGGYLHDIGESLDFYRAEGVAHPGWLMRTANHVLAENVRLGPWIHVSSAVAHHGVARDGDRLSTRARVTDAFERKGHRFVVLDVLIVGPDEGPILRAEHIAIYEPRPASG